MRRINHIRKHTNNPDTLLSTYFTSHAEPRHITRYNINNTLKVAVSVLGLQRYNISPNQVSSHSLRAGGAFALHQANVHPHTIQIMGRWRSDTFMQYIHEQFTAFSTNLSTLMSQARLTHNIQIQPLLQLR